MPVSRIITAVLVLSLAACASLPPNAERSETHAFVDTQDTTLASAIAQRPHGSVDESGFYLLGDGLDAFAARAVLASVAERSIDTQYYMIHSDVISRAI